LVVKLANGASALGLRIFSASILATATLLATFMGGLAFLGLVVVFAGLVHREWFQVASPGRYPAALGLLVACWAAAFVMHMFDPRSAALTALVCGVIGLAVAWRGGHRLAISLVGYIYIVVPTLVFLQLRAGGIELVVLLFVVVWVTDIAAYAAGRAIGGAKLWPAVSPKKTWSGAIGGLVGGSLVGLATAWAFGAEPGMMVQLALLSAVLSVAGQVGDLAESAWKRHFNVKDSGSIIPGHGGVMDRLDSLIVAAPVLAVVQAAGGASF
jgi:phosphatidate cytidylyltransferase